MKIHGISTPVLVLGANQHGALGIIRSLGELGIPVYGTYWGERGPATYSRFCKQAFSWDHRGRSDEESVSRLMDIGREIGRPCLLIPTWDETAIFAAEHHGELSRRFILPAQSPELARNLVSKKDMFRLAKECGVPTAEITVPASFSDVEKFAATAKFPVLLKGSDGNRLKQRGHRKMVIVNSSEELLDLYLEMEDPDNPNLMLQEYIPAAGHVDWMFNGYFDENSDCLVGFTGQKLRQTPVYTGMTSLGICRSNPVVIERTKAWMKQLGYKGVLDMGYRYDHRDGEYKVLDVNPRVGATFRLFVGRDGLDVVRALYLNMTGQSVSPSACREGRKWMVELDFKSCIDYYRDGNLSFVEWWESLSGIEEFGYFRADDVKPFSRVLAKGAKQIFRRRKTVDANDASDVSPLYSQQIAAGGEQVRAVAQQS
jgi:predicted ATP-grasp superfamily ATP-dependent carboligase